MCHINVRNVVCHLIHWRNFRTTLTSNMLQCLEASNFYAIVSLEMLTNF